MILTLLLLSIFSLNAQPSIQSTHTPVQTQEVLPLPSQMPMREPSPVPTIQSSYLTCSDDVTLKDGACPAPFESPPCAYIQNNIPTICSVFSQLNVPFFTANSGTACSIMYSRNSCVYIDGTIPNATIPEICCTLSCPKIGTINDIPERCQKRQDYMTHF